MRDYRVERGTLEVNHIYIDCGEDFYLTIYKLPYDDIELYNVLMIDAYRTPTSELVDKQKLKDKYGVEL